MLTVNHAAANPIAAGGSLRSEGEPLAGPSRGRERPTSQSRREELNERE
jgi:hypothetical protein